jgi:hypothetical protein
MPVREGSRLTFSNPECQRLLQALEIARDALRVQAADPKTDEAVEMACEEASATFDQLRQDIVALKVRAFRRESDPPLEDR